MRVLSNWRSVRLWESEFEQDLHRRHSLRTHGLLIGTVTLLLMWATSSLLMFSGIESLALRYLCTLGVGYLAYLLILRWWAQRLVHGRGPNVDSLDVPDALPEPVSGAAHAPSHTPMPSSGRGGDFGGGGASGDFAGAGRAGDKTGVSVDAPDAGGLGDIASGALEAAASAEEGAIVVVPVVAIFLIGLSIVTGAGALVFLYFGWDALLAVAIEVAFSYVSARAAVRVAREGWLSAAVRLTWKPLLGAILCAVLLGAVIDHFMPQVNSLPAAVRTLMR